MRSPAIVSSEAAARAPRSRVVLLAVASLVGIAFAAWARWPLVEEGLWRDEAISVYAATAPSLSELIARNRVSDYNPPLLNLLLAGYVRVAGSGEMAVKLFALALGLSTIAAAAALAWEIAGPMAAALAASFTLNNLILIQMSAELRAYSLSASLAAASLAVIFGIRRRDRPAARRWVFVAVLLTLLAYSHLAGLLVAAVLGAWGLLEWRRRPANTFGRGLAASAFAAGVAFLPWLPTAWQQFRGGIPWDSPLPHWERLASLLHHSRELLPVPGGFRSPFLLVALVALTLPAVAESARAAAGLRRSATRLSVLAAAGLVVWVALGFFSLQIRYLTIPAVLLAVIAATLVTIVLDAGRDGRWKAVAWAGFFAMGLSAFTSRADFYRDRMDGDAPRSKSGIRDLCRMHPFPPGELVVVAPDYLATTLWYYCGRAESLHGFARWENPVLFDPRGYAELWTDPLAAPRTASRIQDLMRKSHGSRFALVFDETTNEPPLSYGQHVLELRGGLSQSWESEPIGRFPGRLESVGAAELSAPPAR